MPRQPRLRGSSGIYHAMVRGINKRDIFLDNSDRLKYIDTLRRMNTEGEYSLYGYCLMKNHVHLLIKEEADPLHRTMKRIGVSYSYYFNKKYERVGHLFQGRFKSQIIETDNSILSCLKYIHNNPIKANIVNKPSDFKWSSYNTYIGKNDDEIVDVSFVLECFSKDENSAIKNFISFSEKKSSLEDSDEIFLELEEDEEELEIEPLKIIENNMNRYNIKLKELKNHKDKKLRDKIIVEIKNDTNLSIREISKLTGLNKDMIFRAIKKER